MLDAAAAGQLDLIVGTHALLEDRLRLARLGLAVVDEQHRFGVRQRAALRRAGSGENGWQMGGRSGMVPHLLVLSATPIPRSLALTLYGDLDLVHPGRLAAGAEAGRHAPGPRRGGPRRGLSRPSGKSCARAVRASWSARPSPRGRARRGRRRWPWRARCVAQLAPARLGVLHGQLASRAAAGRGRGLPRGELDVLVATTVVEVGVDVPGRPGHGHRGRRAVRSGAAPPAAWPRRARAGAGAAASC